MKACENQARGERGVFLSQAGGRAVVEKAADGICLLDKDGLIRYLNPAGRKMLGYNEDELLGSDAFDLVHPEEFQEAQSRFRECLEHAEGRLILRCRCRHQSGAWIWVKGTSTCLLDDPAVKAVLCSFVDITEQKQMEKALRLANQERERILDSISDYVWSATVDPQGRFSYLFYSSGVQRITGRPPQFFQAGPGRWLSTIHQDDRGRLQQAYDRLVSGKSGREEEEYRILLPDDSIRTVRDSVTAHKLEDGGVQLTGLVSDVTEGRRVEAQLEESLSLMRATLESTTDGILVVDLSGKIQILNRQAIEMWGLPEEVVAWRDDNRAIEHVLDQLLYPEAFVAKVEELYGQPEAESFDTLEFKDGRIYERYSRPQRLGDKPVGRVWSFRDVTSRKRSEAALRKSEERLRVALEGANMGTWDGLFHEGPLRWSENLYRMFGLSPDRFTPTFERFIQRVHPEDREMVRDSFARSLKTRSDTVLEYRTTWPDGSVHWIAAKGRNIYDSEGKLVSMVGVARDITAGKQAEEQLKQYAQDLGSLSRQLMEVQERERFRLARELHDQIGQALTAVQMNLQAFQQGEISSESSRLIKDAQDTLEEALDQVRNISLDLRPSMLDDLGLVAALKWYVNRLPRRTGLRCDFKADPAIVRLEESVETACFRVAQEALTNVMRHAKANTISVKLLIRDGRLHLIVRDDGIGFDFKKARGRAQHGASLGLLGMEERVRLIGGQLEIISEDRRGSELHAYFPVDSARKPIMAQLKRTS